MRFVCHGGDAGDAGWITEQAGFAAQFEEEQCSEDSDGNKSTSKKPRPDRMDANESLSSFVRFLRMFSEYGGILEGRGKSRRHQRAQSRINNGPLSIPCSFERREEVMEGEIVHVKRFGCRTSIGLGQLIERFQPLDLIIRNLPQHAVADEYHGRQVLPAEEVPERDMLKVLVLQDSAWMPK